MATDRTPTSQSNVEAYEGTHRVFSSLFVETKELSKKKPDAVLSKGKVALINRVLSDIIAFLTEEPEHKYLGLLDDDELPQNSDVVLLMSQFDAALKGFKDRHFGYEFGQHQWLTHQLVEQKKTRES